MSRTRIYRLFLPAAILLFGCQLLEPLPTLPPVLTLEPLAADATSGVLLPATTIPQVQGIIPSETSTPVIPTTKTTTRSALGAGLSPAWNDVPIMAGAIHGAEDQGSYSYTVNASVADVQAYYQQHMPAAGWQPFASGEGEAGNLLLMYQKGDITATIGLISQGDNTLVLIVAE
jgi:hypothetical protein